MAAATPESLADPQGGAAAEAAAAASAEGEAGPNSAVGTVSAAEGEAAEAEGVWYFQEPVTLQPAGPWTAAQLRARWRRDQINGLTPVWREGLEGGWRPLAEVTELKEAFQAAAEQETEEEQVARRIARPGLDQIPLTHTWTSEQGILFIYDEVDADWKEGDVYEALLKEECEVERVAEARVSQLAQAAAAGGQAQVEEEQRAEQEQQEAMQELLVVAGAVPSMPALPQAMRASAAAAAASQTASDLAAQAANANSRGAKRALPGSLPEQGADRGGEAAPVDEATLLKQQKRRDYRERKKLKRQAGVFMKAQENPNVYISGLPPDVTAEELEPLFQRAGVLKLDPDTGEPKIRIYEAADGKGCKGDALITYANAASVELAIEFLHEHELRPRTRICVQQADFEEHAKEANLPSSELKALAAARKPDPNRAKYLAAKNAQLEAVSWSGDMDDGSGRRIVLLKHMFSLKEAEADGPGYYVELADEVREECAKIGQVIKVTPIEGHKQGVICVKFKASCEAEECIRVMDGRYFGGQTVEASFYDGRTDLKVLGKGTAAARPPSLLPPSTAGEKDTAGASAPVAGAAAQSTSTPQATTAEKPAQKDVPDAEAAEEAEKPAPEPQKGSKAYEDWLDDQSSGSSSDEEMRINVEE